MRRAAEVPEEWLTRPQERNGHMANLSGAEVLDGLVAFIRRFVVLSDEQACLLALWILHTHAIHAADCTDRYNAKRQAELTFLWVAHYERLAQAALANGERIAAANRRNGARLLEAHGNGHSHNGHREEH